MIAWRKLQAGIKAAVKPQEASKQIVQTTVTQIQTVGAADATHYSKGVLRLATSGQVTTATDDSIAVSPKNLEDGFDGSSNIVTLGTVTAGNVDSVVSAASATLAGKIEIATTAEINTGTDATRAVSPDDLSASNYGAKVIGTLVEAGDITLAIGDAKNGNYFRIPSVCNNWNIVAVAGQVFGVGSTGTASFQLRNVTDGSDVLSTKLTIDSGEKDSSTAATAAVINTANDDVATGDLFTWDVDSVHSVTAPKGFYGEVILRNP